MPSYPSKMKVKLYFVLQRLKVPRFYYKINRPIEPAGNDSICDAFLDTQCYVTQCLANGVKYWGLNCLSHKLNPNF